jgi:hypothetical protein
MAVLQNCMDCVESDTGSYSETCVECDVDATEKVWIKEEPIDIEDEIPEDISSPSSMTEHEVRFRGGVLLVGGSSCFLDHLLQKKNCEIKNSYFLLCVVLWVPCTF